ncbi:DUF6702 family protein [Ekhidna sp.]
MISLFLIPLYFLSLDLKADHDIYLSVLEIDNQEMKIKVFSDNLKDALKNDNTSIEDYFRKKIKLQINNQKIEFFFKDSKVEGDSHWITFNLDTPKKWQSFHLEADYFMELFPDQINVIKVLGEKPQFFKLTKADASCSF